ncbi:glycosyltransferase family 4 protein [Sphingobacterium humi]|uniref:Glycosyltransferase n=1 Tax=Sphingobacterium humi TaxID=1796905 RepID=A0A6N8KXK4_9SPHI|nr:glycosyltransferase family 4 protein [Sphingobacterium humi]MVZ60981.1 glycosyltransferase [Sphingobacterium humi]
MKIVYCISGIFNSGGMERVLANKANYLQKHGYEIVIITTDQRNRNTFFSFDPQIKHIDLDINYDLNNNKSLLSKVWSYPSKQRLHKKKLEAALKELKADVVISMFDHDVSFLHSISDGSEKLLEIHFSRFKRIQYGRKGFWGAIDRYRSKQDAITAAKYKKFVVLTQEDKKLWGNMKNMEVIPNANSFESDIVSNLQQKHAIAVGRFDYQKGFDELIDTWKIVNLSHPDWVLDIYGHGPLLQSYIQRIKAYGLENVIILHEPVKDIRNAYLNKSMVVMTSRYEGFGMVLIEAQVCGLPLLAYACKCGPRDIIEEGKNGMLFPVGDINGLAKGIISLIENKELRKTMGKEAKLMASNFSEDKVMHLWMKLFDGLSD